jgi:hypothetical protein
MLIAKASVHLPLLTATLLCLPAGAAGPTETSDQGPRSQWVYFNPDGKLGYKTLPGGDRVMDFSFAGYMEGGSGPADRACDDHSRSLRRR